MLDLFQLGSAFLSYLKPVGDWLQKPISEVLPEWVQGAADIFGFLIPSVGAPTLNGSSSVFLFAPPETTVAMWLFGAGLIGILTFKLIKFVTNLV